MTFEQRSIGIEPESKENVDTWEKSILGRRNRNVEHIKVLGSWEALQKRRQCN